MGIRIFFILSFLFLLFGLIFVYKVPERVSLFRSAVICYITELCLGAVFVGVYSLVGIPIGLISLGIAYFIMGTAALGIILFQRKTQKVEIINVDVYSALIIMLWFLIIFLIVFSTSIQNVYMFSDPITHYQWALSVLNTGKVSNMYFAEVYNAAVMELLSPFLTKYSMYKAFVLADSFANLINVFMFYCLTASMIKSRFSKIILPFLSFLYFAGWPFFSYVFGGYVYFGWGVTLYAYVIYLLIKLYDCGEKRNRIILLGLVLLGSFSVLVTYLLFEVTLAGIVLLCFICTAKKNGFIISKKQILKIGIVICLLGAGIFSVCFFGFFGGDLTYVLSALSEEGWTPREFYQDFVFLMPAVFYMGWRYIKSREVNIIFICISVILAYIGCTFIMCLLGIMSSYYYYKSYYLLWFFAWIINVVFIEYIYEKEKALLFSFGGVLLAAILITMSGFDNKLVHRGIAYDDISHRIYPSIFPLFDYMEAFITMDHLLPDKNALVDLSKYVNESFAENENIPIISDSYYSWVWYEIYTGNDYITIVSDEEFAQAIQECKDRGCQYIAVYQNTKIYKDNKELVSDYEIVIDNGYYGIYKLQ